MISENSSDYIDIIERDPAIINREIGKKESDHGVLDGLGHQILQHHANQTDKSDKSLIRDEVQLSQLDSAQHLDAKPYESKFIEHPLDYLLKLSNAFIKRWKKVDTDESSVDPVIETVAILLGGCFILMVFSIIIILLL